MPVRASRIVARHRDSLRGSLELRRLRSRSLGISKPYFVYEPPGLRALTGVPILYLFRGHQREWVNMREDGTRLRSTAIEDLDARIAAGTLPPFVAVMPGIASVNNHVPSLGINMVGRWGVRTRGLGTGRFWDFLVGELLPTVEQRYEGVAGPRRFAAGFSLGGYTASLLAVKHPAYFTDVGIFDGLFMWPGHWDPRGGRVEGRGWRVEGQAHDETHDETHDECSDPVWCRSPLFDAALGRPRDKQAMREWNATDALVGADDETLAVLRQTSFFVASAPSDGKTGNVDRTSHFVHLLSERQIPLTFGSIVFDAAALHSWHWADRFLMGFLESASASR